MKTSAAMQKIITRLAQRHGIDITRPGASLRLDMPGFYRLCIENIGFDRISVAHYYEEAGDLVPDPDIVFYTAYREWVAISIQNAFGYIEAGVMTDDMKGLKGVYTKQQEDLAEFTNLWAKNIEEQGWMERGSCTSKDSGEPVVKVDLRSISRN
jgi:hypothetical protein